MAKKTVKKEESVPDDKSYKSCRDERWEKLSESQKKAIKGE